MNFIDDDVEQKQEKVTVEEFRKLKDLKTKLEGRVSVLKALKDSKEKELGSLLAELPEDVPKKDLDGYVKGLQSTILTDTNKLASILKKVQEQLDSVDD